MACAGLLVALAGSGAWAQTVRSSEETLNWFKKTEQALLDAIAKGDTQIWDRVLDDEWVMTWKMVASQFVVVRQDPPAQSVDTSRWPGLVGTYRLQPDGWTFHVVLQGGTLYGGRDPQKLKPFVPLTPDAFTLQGSLGEWLFVLDRDGKASHIVDLRKFETLIWSRISDTPEQDNPPKFAEPPAETYTRSTMHVTIDGKPQAVNAGQVTNTFFTAAHVRPYIGRFFIDADYRGTTPVVVISFSLWQRLGASPEIIGSQLHIDGRSLTVVGVAEREFNFPKDAELWMPKARER